MNEFFYTTSFEGRPAATIALRVGCSRRVAVEEGLIWLTRSGDSHDYWLAAGETLALNGGERLWLSVEGNRPARVSFSRRARCDERLIGGLMAWLRGGSAKPKLIGI
jgi:Protein of unknown function (DUF2917)